MIMRDWILRKEYQKKYKEDINLVKVKLTVMLNYIKGFVIEVYHLLTLISKFIFDYIAYTIHKIKTRQKD